MSIFHGSAKSKSEAYRFLSVFRSMYNPKGSWTRTGLRCRGGWTAVCRGWFCSVVHLAAGFPCSGDCKNYAGIYPWTSGRWLWTALLCMPAWWAARWNPCGWRRSPLCAARWLFRVPLSPARMRMVAVQATATVVWIHGKEDVRVPQRVDSFQTVCFHLYIVLIRKGNHLLW